MPTPNSDDPRRRLLAVVPTSRLAEWARDAGITTAAPGGAAGLVDALLDSRRFPATARKVLERMVPHELELACRDLGGIGGSLDRARLEERILAILAPPVPAESSASPASTVPPPPSIPIGAWLEGQRHRAAVVAERDRLARRLLESMGFRAGVWGAFFFALAWLLVFAHTVDALLLGLGVGAIAFAIYRYALPIPLAMLLATTDVATRFLLFGFGAAATVSLVSIVFAELVLAAVMAIDAHSCRTSEITLGFREHLAARSARPEEPEPEAGTEAPLPEEARSGSPPR